MDRTLLRLYHLLPAHGRNLAASLRGQVLALWRYGPETERLVYETLERDTWSPKQWKEWCEERLSRILFRALNDVPYYRESWARRRQRGDRSSPDYLENWPVLDKERIRENPTAFVADDCDLQRMSHEHTSGTTGKPLSIWVSKESSRVWYALSEARWHRWYGVTRHDRWAILGGQLVAPVQQRRPPFWVWNRPQRQLYLSVYHLASDLLPHYIEAIRHYEVTYLYGYSSALYSLAEGVLNQGCDDLVMSVVISNAEPMFDYQRKTIEEAFQCPVRETYGMSEMVAGASECESGNLHYWKDSGWLEVMEDGTAETAVGEFLCTGFSNPDMPLIRYKVGDRGNFVNDPVVCGCGRTLPIITSIDGRTDDVLLTPDGRKIGRLDPVFKADLPIREAQIVQEQLDRVRIRYVPTPDFRAANAEELARSLKERLGDVEVILEETARIPRGAGGKFKAVICELPQKSSK